MTDSTINLSLKQEPLLVVISGPSGVGKRHRHRSIEVAGLLFTLSSQLPPPAAPDERHGIDYLFLSHDEFAG
jgi:guanylate kinase